MRPIRSLSVLMPTWQGMEFLERSLTSLAGQKLSIPWDFLAIDSGSSDGTWELLGEFEESFPVPFRRKRIHSVEFDHGDTRNLLAALSDGDLLVFLTQDAIPKEGDFLELLLANFENPRVAAAYSRNLPRPDARVITKLFSEGDSGYQPGRREVSLPSAEKYAAMSPHEKRLLYNFNDVASSVRRELWERHPFPRAQFGEDILMARALLEAGYTVVYDDKATVEHSHDYDPAETRSRCETDARFNAEWLNRVCVASDADAVTLTERVAAEDRRSIEELPVDPATRKSLIGEARALRRATFEGLRAGSLATDRHAGSRLLDETKLSILYVVHGFPPDTWAGTEIYTLNLALEMQRRGHRCTVLARVPGEGDEPPDFSIEESEFEGLRVLRMTNRLEHATLRESYHQPLAEYAFRRVLGDGEYDLVHFQHLIHMSAGLVHVARAEGLPTIIHLHDYWSICPRVQLIRPDGEICSANQGLGCHLCVKETAMEGIGFARELTETCAPVLRQLADMKEDSESKLARRLVSLRDLIDRQPYVLEAYAAADLRISPSRFLRQKLLESGAFDPRTTLFSDNGMRTDHVHSLEKQPDPQGRIRFGFVGSLVWYKGCETMVRAMRHLSANDAVLNVYGDFKPDSDSHHAELARLASGSPVNFMGRFDNSRLSEVYAEIDVLVVPSLWYENSPITIHEAYLTQTPVLSSDIGGMAEYVHDGVDGLHFKVGNARDLARKMQRFVDEPGLVEALSQDFMEIKTIEDNAKETEFRYRSLVTRFREPIPHGSDVVEYEGVEFSSTTGDVQRQGADMMLLGMGASCVEYDVSFLLQGVSRVEIEVPLFADEEDVFMQGRVLLDGREVGQVARVSSQGADEVHVLALDFENSVASRLQLENEPGIGFLRVSRIRVVEGKAMQHV